MLVICITEKSQQEKTNTYESARLLMLGAAATIYKDLCHNFRYNSFHFHCFSSPPSLSLSLSRSFACSRTLYVSLVQTVYIVYGASNQRRRHCIDIKEIFLTVTTAAAVCLAYKM